MGLIYHGHIRRVVTTDEADPNTRTVWSQLHYFLLYAKTVDGKSLWDKILEKVGPRPKPWEFNQ